MSGTSGKSVAKFALCALLGLFATAARAATVVEYIHTDALGSPVATTSSTGAVTERTVYEPYGAVVNRPLTNGPGYTGHVTDAATSLTYMQQRYYDPSIGRFVSVDAVLADSLSGGNFDRYWYGDNNPYRFIDPFGLTTYDCTKGSKTCPTEMRLNELRKGMSSRPTARPSRLARPLSR